MVPRPQALQLLRELVDLHPVTAMLGPRQCGKTTLARHFAESHPAHFFDLENPIDRQRLASPLQTLATLPGLVVIDEVQRAPSLFEVLRVLVDQPRTNQRYLLLGSAAPTLVRGVSESLAGRVGFLDLGGFDLREVGSENQDKLWLRGGFPAAFLAASDETSMAWRDAFARTFLERDLPQLGISVPAETLRRFWTMIAHLHGQVWNGAYLARSMGSSESTVRRYLDLLAGAYMVRILPPWTENLGKRQIKAPKVYLRDSGILHSLLQIGTRLDLLGNPKLGFSWEGFAIEQILTILRTRDAYFWGTHAGAELDLFVLHRGRRLGFEIKFHDAPSRTRSMTTATTDLQLDHLFVIYPGDVRYPLGEKITALPLAEATSGAFVATDRR